MTFESIALEAAPGLDLRASAPLRTGDAPLFDVSASWSAFRWPLAGDPLIASTRGSLEARGWTEFSYRVSGDFVPAQGPPIRRRSLGPLHGCGAARRCLVLARARRQRDAGRIAGARRHRGLVRVRARRRHRSVAAAAGAAGPAGVRVPGRPARDSRRTVPGRRGSATSTACSGASRHAAAAGLRRAPGAVRIRGSLAVARARHACRRMASSAAAPTSMPASSRTTSPRSSRSSAGAWTRRSACADDSLAVGFTGHDLAYGPTARSSCPSTPASTAKDASIPGCASVRTASRSPALRSRTRGFRSTAWRRTTR